MPERALEVEVSEFDNCKNKAGVRKATWLLDYVGKQLAEGQYNYHSDGSRLFIGLKQFFRPTVE